MQNRETIESALQRVQSGELSPAEATILLLAADENGHSPSDSQHESLAPLYESLASLINRLGEPPTDIVDSWCQQLGDIARVHEEETGESLPAFDLSQWSIIPQGDLIWQGRLFGTSRLVTRVSRASLGRIDEFRAQLIPNATLAAQRSSFLSDREGFGAPVVAQTGSGPKSAKHPKGHSDSWGLTAFLQAQTTQRALIVGAVLLCVSILGSILHNASRSRRATTTNIDTSAMFATDIGPASASIADPQTTQLADSELPVTTETLESMSEAERSSMEADAIEMKPSFLLDDLMPPAASFVPQAKAKDDADKLARQDDGPPAKDSQMPASDAVEQVIGDDDTSPAESPQRTRASTVMAVDLGGVDETIEPTQLSQRNLTGLQLDFPFDVPLTISGDESTWEVRDSRKETSVAVITHGPDGLGLKWSESAKESPSASALGHGRITDRDGRTIFLRPIIEADPWPIHFDKPDVMPTWNLRYPIPPRVARISVDLDLPEEIEQGWIEPVQSDSPRRTRGLAVLTPKDAETVSLGIRFDIRCSRKLSCRVRYAGRLDASMPWQVVSVSLLEQFADQLAHQAILVSKEASRLAAIYEIAGTSGRRILRVKRDRNDAQADTIRTALKRVAQLQTLIAALEAEGLLKIRVWVEWPDAQQTLLTMQTIDAQQEEGEK